MTLVTASAFCRLSAIPCHSQECTAFQSEGLYIADWMRSQAEVKEESITDSYLYRLARATPIVRYVSFSRWDEARRTGADWEWWFVLPGRSLKLRVQAKKLRRGRNCRGDLARKNKHGGQLRMLIKRARQNKAIPIYAFYSSDTITQTACGLPSASIGTFIVNARSVDALLKMPGRIAEAQLIQLSRAATCLPCCILRSGKAAGTIDVGGWLDTRQSKQGDVLNETEEGWHDALPRYVRRIMMNRSEVGYANEKVESDAPGDIGGIVIVDMREPGGQ